MVVGTGLNKCTSIWRTGTVTVLVNPQMVCLDGVLNHVRGFRCLPYTMNNLVEDKILASSDDKMYITVGSSGDGDDCLINSDLGGSSNEGQHLTGTISEYGQAYCTTFLMKQ